MLLVLGRAGFFVSTRPSRDDVTAPSLPGVPPSPTSSASFVLSSNAVTTVPDVG
jgi:hypothetical protein